VNEANIGGISDSVQNKVDEANVGGISNSVQDRISGNTASGSSSPGMDKLSGSSAQTSSPTNDLSGFSEPSVPVYEEEVLIIVDETEDGEPNSRSSF
jgi:hypothetical protein